MVFFLSCVFIVVFEHVFSLQSALRTLLDIYDETILTNP